MIWYPVKAFAAKGYAVPKTWDELVALSDKIIADGSHPFCVSAGGPGTATGWELTDWIEEVLAKTEDPQVTTGLVQAQDHVRGPEDQGRLRQGRLAAVQGRLDRRWWPADRQQRPQDRHGSHVQRGHGHAGLLDAEDPDLVRPGLLPGSPRQRWRLQVHDRRQRGHRDLPVPDHLRPYKGVEGSSDSFMVLPIARKSAHSRSSSPRLKASRAGSSRSAFFRRTTRSRPSGTPTTTS